MVKTSERAITKSITDYLKTLPQCWFFKVRGGPLQLAGVPDIIACYYGHFIGIEVKRPGGKMSEIQRFVSQKIVKAGGTVLLVESVEGVKVELETLTPRSMCL